MKITKLQVLRLAIVLFCLAASQLLGGRLSWLWLGFTVLVFGPFYCGWTCPFGTISRLSSKIGRHFFPNWQVKLPEKLNRWLPLCKYLFFLCFLGVAVLPQFGITALQDRLPSIRSLEALKTVFAFPVALFAANFYCRYFCWHKAQYNLFGHFSPTAITVNKSKCIDCQACQRACPMGLKITEAPKTRRDCVLCLQCVEACPSKVQAAQLTFYGRPVNPYFLGSAYFLLFFALLLSKKYMLF